MKSKKRWIGSVFVLTLVFLCFDSPVLIAQETYKIGVILSTAGRYSPMGTGQKLGQPWLSKRLMKWVG